ncbi:hypothetical protein [Tetragenococcus halophilus]|uniref:hypothetical protein n=1 Tax=Tetragenococcus halophilus TaxID=51669 RepID=UPI001B73778E|nr:hypothetical protein [Tetragenococcus halophilus]GFK23662.1 hypothetical protein YA163_07250 [Tetragenococcus halophilus]GMG64335.1 hypothetical protein TEHAL1_18100 [Tetragenococcus halophilus]GMG66603.1 hypothetical protein TEHIT2_17940 [Tetragenococcus halophilus]GMG69210.1 hypothetical protein TEHMS4_21470 [Tetragenococcus halophilus]GMQ74621.1 hypothetical protein TEHSL10_22570 [Tetragenococcus halophilus]
MPLFRKKLKIKSRSDWLFAVTAITLVFKRDLEKYIKFLRITVGRPFNEPCPIKK